jgi:hypothetical protein
MRLFKFRQQDRINRRDALSGIPILAPSATIQETEDGGVKVTVTRKRGSGFFERIRPPLIERSYELDEFGKFVIDEIDGKRSVLDIINKFEKRFPMSRREAELSVVAFFKLLMERHVVSVAVTKEAPVNHGTKALSFLLVLGLFCLTAQSASALDKKIISPETAQTMKEITQLVSYGSIAPGTVGNLALENKVADLFSKSGYENGEMKFDAPIFKPGKLALDCGESGNFMLDALHPSLMRPGNFKEQNFNTHLVYLGNGDMKALEDAKGIALEGAVVVMDYNSFDRWNDLLRFGIRGVVFVGNGDYSHQQAVTKVNNSEVSFPRFFIDGEDGEKLLNLCKKKPGIKVKASATPSRWEKSFLRNLWVLIPGSDKRMSEQVMVITAPLDANSVVPARATGAQRLVNLHILLKLLEDYRKTPPGHSVMLVAVNGHTNRYSGERLLAWHLLADEVAIENQRDMIAQEMRIARLFTSEYSKLKLNPVDEKQKYDLHIMMELMWLLYDEQQQQGENRPETESEEAETDTAAMNAAQPLEDADEIPFNTDDFLDDELKAALAKTKKKVMDGYSGFFATRGRKPSEVAAEKKEDLAIFEQLAKLPIPELRKKLKGVEHVFDDERLFEEWRSKLDESTGRRTYIKSQLQDEFKGKVNEISMEMMALSVSKELTKEEIKEKIAELKKLKNNARKVLVLFNKMDIGVGRSRTYYRQIAVNDTQRKMLREAKNKYVNKFASWEGTLQTNVDMDMKNGAVRMALGARKVALVIPLDLDTNGKRFGFSYEATETTPDGFRDFGGVLNEIADSTFAQENPYVDALSSDNDKTPAYFFRFPESGVGYFQAAKSTPAVSMKTAFTSSGTVFGPDDTTASLDSNIVHHLQDKARRFIIAISKHEDVLSPTVLKPVVKKRNAKWYSWSSRVRTYAMAEYTGKPIPSEEIPGTMVTVNNKSWGHHINPSLVNGDVVNAYRGITDITGYVSFYGLCERRRLSPLGYRMDEDFINVTDATDKGRIQSSKQINSNLQRGKENQTQRLTLPMFKCREFVIKDRRDPSLLASQPIEVFTYWPKIAEGKSNPVKYGVNGAFCLSPAQAYGAWGPVGIYLEKPKKGRPPKSLMVITNDKRCLLNAKPGTKEDQEGLGFENPDDMPDDFFMQVSHDMQILNHFRDQELKGVVNQLLNEFMAKGKKHNELAMKQKELKNHLEFVRQNYQAIGNEMKAYAEMQTMSGDMLQSIVVFMALMIPFCFFLQKLLFAFRKLEHELLGFSLMFFSIFVIFRLIHPAFALAMNPEAIFIAFVLGSIGAFTTWVLYGRFHGEMQVLMRGIGGIGENTAYGTVGQTATIIGVQNMRRRRVRTTLTTATIILVVFTMLAFSSVSRKAKPTLINKSDAAPYTGILYHWPAGKPMTEGISRVLETMMSKKGKFRIRRSSDSKVGWRMERKDDPERYIDIKAISGLPKDDIVLRDSMALVVGNYFSSDNAKEALLPVSAAEALGISDSDVGKAKVRVNGYDLTVCGLLHDQRYRAARDLNPTLPLMPLGPDPKPNQRTEEEKEGSLEIQVIDIEKRLLDPGSVAVIPVELAKEFGAKPCAVSVVYPDNINEMELGEELNCLLEVTQAKFYIGSKNPFRLSEKAAAPVDPGVYYVGSSYRTTIGGFAKLIIPLIIAGSIILNTMLGTVYERKSEIAVFNAIGLNPTHIFMFFLAEAMVYSFIGAVGGYLIGQVLTVAIKSTGLIQDMNINFSSLIVVYAILLTMFLVMLSTIYPGYVATRLAVPSGKRKWSMPDHDGNQMQVVFPCIYRPELAYGIMYYLYSFFEPLSQQSSGDIIAEFQEAHEEKDKEGRHVLVIKYHLALAPYDLGVTQHATFKATYDEIVKSYRLHMDVERDSGRDTNWVTTNRPFLERMRKYLIRWRNIDPTRQNWYVKHADELFQKETE